MVDIRWVGSFSVEVTYAYYFYFLIKDIFPHPHLIWFGHRFAGAMNPLYILIEGT